VDLTSLDTRRVSEGLHHRAPQRLRAVDDHEDRPVGPQAATLQIAQHPLANRRIFGRSVPEPEWVFLTGRVDPERHDQTALREHDAVDEEGHQIQVVERGRLPGPHLRAGSRDEPPAHAARTIAR